MKFNEDWGPSNKMQRAPRNCVTKDLCGNYCSLPCECNIINVPPHVAKQLTMIYGTINKQTNDKSPVQLRGNSESSQHNKYAYGDIQQINTGLQLPDSQQTTVKCHRALTSHDNVKRLNTVKRCLQYDEDYGQSKLRKHPDFTLEEKTIDLIQTKLQDEESIFNIHSDMKNNEVYNSTCDKMNTFVNTVQRNSTAEMHNVSNSNFISKNYGCICTCCHGKTFQRYECVIFLQCNYNLLIPNVAKALFKRYKATKCKEFICKKCNALLKSGKIPEIVIKTMMLLWMKVERRMLNIMWRMCKCQ